jgi:hypothetical protein
LEWIRNEADIKVGELLLLGDDTQHLTEEDGFNSIR